MDERQEPEEITPRPPYWAADGGAQVPDVPAYYSRTRAWWPGAPWIASWRWLKRAIDRRAGRVGAAEFLGTQLLGFLVFGFGVVAIIASFFEEPGPRGFDQGTGALLVLAGLGAFLWARGQAKYRREVRGKEPPVKRDLGW